MSVEAPKAEETTLAPAAKPVESTIAPAETTTPVATETPVAAEATKEAAATPAAETAAKDDAVEAKPATEGTLGYKGPGLLKQLRYVKHFFWLNEEPLTQEALDSYVKNEKADAHHKAAWAQETGKGCLFFAKRAEDKATPSGIILLPEATGLTKVGTDFSFKVGNHTHKFEASSAAECESWVLAIRKIVEESKDLKADVTGRESYKKTVEGYSSFPTAVGASTSPKKSLDANTATAAATTEAGPAAKPEESSASSAEDAKKNKGIEKKTKKERSQSRKRNSVFGLFGKKDEDKAAEKAEKEHEKEVKKAEAEQKKEEAKTEHDSSKGKEAVEAAATAAAPAAVAASVEKEEDKKENPAEKAEEVTTPTEKKSKRASVFGGFFGKNKVTSPSQEKTAEEAGPAVPAKDETSAVSETAPKLDEPIDTKPIDAAAVTAPVDNPESAAAPAAAASTAEEPKTAEPVSAADTATTPKTEKKGFLAGLIKKHDKKEEAKEETKTSEDAAKETATPAATAETAATEPAAETSAKEAEAPKEERPAREKRRTSLFGSLGTLKRKTEKSPGPESAEEQKTETKREKSPLPSKLGGLFRRPSRATKTEEPAKEVKTEETADAAKTEAAAEAPKTEETPATAETPANATTIEPKGDSEIVGDVVPDNLHTTVQDAAAQKPEEVKATA